MSQQTYIRPECSCGRKLARIPKMEFATVVVRRTCRACGFVWSVRVVPQPCRIVGASMHVCDLQPIEASR